MDPGIVLVWAGAPALPVRRLLTAGVTGLLLAVACGPGPAPAPRPPAPTAQPSAAPRQSMDAWRSRGATEIPPDTIRHVTMDGIQVVNQATGAVSDADAKAWAEALMRSSNYDDWALNRMQEGFYLSSGLSAVPQTVFSYELSRVQEARLAGDRIEATSQMVRRLVLRAVPAAVRPLFETNLMAWDAYAFYMDKVGPGDLWFVDGSGGRVRKDHLDAGVGVPELYAGVLVHDPVLGDVWRLDSDFDCSAAVSRVKLGALCDP